MSWPSPPARSIHLPASAICAAHRPRHWACRAGGRRCARVPGHTAAQPFPARICPCAEGEPGCRCARSHFSQSWVLWAASTAGGFSLDPVRGGWEGWRGVRLVSKTLPSPPGHLPSRSPPLPPATRTAAASSVPRALRGAVPAQLRAKGRAPSAGVPFPPSLSCRFHSSSSSQRLHPAQSSQSLEQSVLFLPDPAWLWRRGAALRDGTSRDLSLPQALARGDGGESRASGDSYAPAAPPGALQEGTQ